MIQALNSIPNLLAAVCSALAAYHWYRASQVKDPPSALVGSVGWDTPVGVDAKPLVEYARESRKRNKTAALWSAAAAAFAGLGWALGLFAGWGSHGG
jgi:hypothetical protein